jgi:hypothetical protein
MCKRIITLPTYGEDNAITITPDGRRIYVPYVLFNGTPDFPEIVAVIDTATDTVTQTVVVEPASSVRTVNGIANVTERKIRLCLKSREQQRFSDQCRQRYRCRHDSGKYAWRDFRHSAEARTRRKLPLIPSLSNYRDFAPTELSSAR